ncbi:MAG: glucose-6-phosphate dehydrogenase, partial [Deinococcus sp.]|nr:glucose-6-phosphate dehydrogenase [Deinococcus sp.]
ERLLLDCMLGDSTLFNRRDETEAAWALITPLFDHPPAPEDFPNYPAGSWGPPAAFALLECQGRNWRRL